MPDTPLDKLEIQITSSSEGAEKKVNALADALERLSNMSSLKGIGGVAKKISTIGEASKKISITVDPSSDKALDGIIDKVGVLQRAIEKVNATAINIPSLSKQTGGKSKTTTQTVQADASISGTSEVASGQVEKVKGNVSALNNVKKSADEASASINKMKKTLSDQWSTWSSLKGMVQGVKDKILETAAGSEKISKGLLKVIPVVGVIKTVLSGAVSIVKKIGSAFIGIAKTIASGVVTGVKNIASGLKTIGKHVLSYVTKPFTKAIAVIQKWKAALARVAFYRLVRSAIKMVTDGFKEGIENLYYFSSLTESQFKPAMDSLASSSLYLKNSLGAMAAPLIQAVAPAVNYLIDLFVTLLNVINMVFSVLGGRTYTKALKTSAKYADDLDKSLGGGASSAKELQRYLIGIDQLTIMPDEPNSGGGGGGGLDLGSQYEEMFEEVPLPDWVLNIKDAINAGDWTGAGELLAGKVNGLIDALKDNAKSWGRNIGKSIQKGLKLGLGFIRKVDIEGVGESITSLIGNAMNSIKPRDLGAIIASGIKSAFRFASGLLQGYNGPEIGTYLANVVNGWFAELRSNGGWEQAAKDLNNIILGIVNGVSNFLESLDTDSIEKDLKDFFGNIGWNEIWSSLEHLAEAAANNIPWKNMFNGLLRVAANALVFVHDTILKIPATDATRYVWNTLTGKIQAGQPISFTDIFSGLTAFFGDSIDYIASLWPEDGWESVWDSLKEKIAGALTNGGTWEDLKEQLKETIVNVIGEALRIASVSLYEVVVEEHPKIARMLFPNAEVEIYGGQFQDLMRTQGHDAAYEFIHELLDAGTISRASAQKIIEESAAGITENKSTVTSAASDLMKDVDDILLGTGGGGKAGSSGAGKRRISLELDARRTKEFESAIEQISETNDKAATLSATVNNTNATNSEIVQQVWSETTDKTVTLRALVVDSNPKAREAVKNAWEAAENKNVTLKATVREANTKVSESIQAAWKEISNKTATLNAKIVDAMSSTREKMLDAWDKLATKTATLTARVSNPNEGALSGLMSTWKSLENKSVTVTAKGVISNSVNDTKYALNSIVNKSATVTVYGALTNAFNSMKSAYDSIKSKTVSVTVTGRSSGIGGRASGGIFSGGSWHNIAGYAGGGNPKRARLFYANENGIPELVGRIGSNTAVMNNGQIVASVSSGVYRAVSAAMGGIGSYFANIATGMSHIPDALRDITPVSPQPITLERDMSVYQQMEAGGYNRYTSDSVSAREQESTEHIINAIMAMGHQIITAINENGGDFYLDGQAVGTRTTEIQNRQSRIYGKAVATT